MTSLWKLPCETLVGLARLLFWQRRNARYIVLLGPPGAGKGTLAQDLAPLLGSKHLNMGHIVRDHMERGTWLASRYGHIVKSGGLLPDAVVLRLAFEELRKPEYNSGAVLDGIPRTTRQSAWMRLMLASWGHRISAALSLEISEQDVLERLSLRRMCSSRQCGATYHLRFQPPARDGLCDRCGAPLMQREDDQPEVVRKRLAVYRESSAPLIRYFRRKRLLLRLPTSNETPPEELCQTAYFALKEIE